MSRTAGTLTVGLTPGCAQCASEGRSCNRCCVARHKARAKARYGGVGTFNIPPLTTPRKSYGEKRVCAAKGCETRLNRYHEGEYCYHCDGEEDAA